MSLRPPRITRLFWQSGYAWVLFPLLMAVITLAALLSPRSSKLKASLRGRRGLWDRLDKAMAGRDETKPLVWFHVSSAGEFLQALPVIERLLRANRQCALTVSSISGYEWARKRQDSLPGLLLVDYLPMDFRGNMRRILRKLRPQVVVYVKYDLWPNLVWQTRKAGIPQFLVSGTLHSRSARVTGFMGRSLFRAVYEDLDVILTVTDADRERFLRTCPGHAQVITTGDTRFDSVLDRKERLQPPLLPKWFSTRLVLVVGSSWPQDEAHILPGLVTALEAFSDLTLIVAPHEMKEEHLLALENTFKAFAPVRYTRLDAQEAHTQVGKAGRVLLFDTVGQLAALYHHAALAYVGGGFSTGVHNVMEPSVMGAPAMFGPFHQNSPEALELAERGQGFPIGNGTAFNTLLTSLLENPVRLKEIGAQAADYVRQNSGAADRCLRIIEDHLHAG